MVVTVVPTSIVDSILCGRAPGMVFDLQRRLAVVAAAVPVVNVGIRVDLKCESCGGAPGRVFDVKRRYCGRAPGDFDLKRWSCGWAPEVFDLKRWSCGCATDPARSLKFTSGTSGLKFACVQDQKTHQDDR